MDTYEITKRLDMTGAESLGPKDGRNGSIVSICYNCKYPLRDCQWLLHGKPYAGSRYYTFIPRPTKTNYSGCENYVIVECPNYVA